MMMSLPTSPSPRSSPLPPHTLSLLEQLESDLDFSRKSSLRRQSSPPTDQGTSCPVLLTSTPTTRPRTLRRAPRAAPKREPCQRRPPPPLKIARHHPAIPLTSPSPFPPLLPPPFLLLLFSGHLLYLHACTSSTAVFPCSTPPLTPLPPPPPPNPRRRRHRPNLRPEADRTTPTVVSRRPWRGVSHAPSCGAAARRART